MRSEVLVNELAGIVRRMEQRINRSPKYAALLEQDSTDQSLQVVLEGIEDAIAGLVMLHIQLRRDSK